MRLYIKLVPRASRNNIEKISDEEYKAWVTAPPVQGKANEALIKLVADTFDIPKRNVEIIGGKTSRTKIVDVLLS